MRITIASDTTFLICDDLGNVLDGTELGLYHEDTRFLSAYELTLDGQAPLLLAAHPTAPFSATHFLTNPILSNVPRGRLGIIRRRHVNAGMQEEIEITCYGDQEAAFALDLRIDADFSHLFEAKHEIQMTKHTVHRVGSYSQRVSEGGRRQRFSYIHGQRARQMVVELSEQPVVKDGRCRFNLRLAPGETWRLAVAFQPVKGTEPAGSALSRADDPREQLLARHQRYRDKLVAAAPALHTDSLVLRRAYNQSVQDFAALQIAAEEGAEDEFIIAAGIPWFMTLFGRDSLLAAYQALPFFPDAATGTLRALARLQGTRVDKLRVEEPGKILHEYRSPGFLGTEYSAAVFPYYGTIDATPLFLVLLADVCRVTGDVSIARELRENALRALEWMDSYGDRDGDGYIEYIKEAEWGLDNQGWKDSGDAVRYRDGALARPPIAVCEVQGYAYAARIGMARVFDALGEPARSAALRQEAATLRERFNRDFWMPDRGYFAFGLDGEKRQIDALTSNPGHLLWSGIADDEKARMVAERLLTPELFSGWGVRTFATAEGGYNPISYHLGSVWPHDNSLIVAGLARYGYTEPASRIVAGLLRALEYYPDSRLPELFAGYSLDEAPFPVEYPTASRPQAWAAGSIFLLLSAMTGLDVAAREREPRPFLPSGIGHIRLEGVWLDGRKTAVDAGS